MYIKDTLIKILGAVFVLLLFLVPIVLALAFDLDFEITMLFSLGGALVIFVVTVVVSIFVGSAIEAKHSGEIECYLDDHMIKIKARNTYIANYLSIQPETYSSLKYNSAQLTYTSTTVGPVTTGSFDYQPESLSLASTEKTGNYYLNFGDKYAPVYTIILSAPLVKEAKKDALISKFLIEDRLVLRHSPRATSTADDEIRRYTSLGTSEAFTKALNVGLQEISARSKLSRSECKALRKWLAGK